jgi:NDP-sugar pyrophosphorylase family protein
MKAVILAGGYGTRLWPLTLNRPKPMLLLGDKPALHHIIEYLSGHGFDEIIITTNYLKNKIMEYFKSYPELDAKLIYSDEYTPLGTAGSVKKAANYLDDTFALIQGDNITDIDLMKMLEFHKKRGGVATIALKEVEKPYLFGVVETNSEKRIILFKEKPKVDECFSKTINTGIYILEPKIFDYIPSNKEYDFAKDLFPQLLSYNEKLYGFEAEGFWVDIGTPEGYLEASDWLLSRLEGKCISNAEIRNATIKGPVLIGKDTRVDKDAIIYGPAVIGERCNIKSGAIIDSYSVIESDVEVSINTNIKRSIIYRNTHIGSSSWLNDCIVDEGCNIGNNVRIVDMSIIGARCEIGHFVSIQDGSRVWSDIKVTPRSVVKGFVRHLEHSHFKDNFKRLVCKPNIVGKEDAERILKRLPPDKAFYFFKSIGDYIGKVAFSLDGFCNLLNIVSIDSIEFHIKRNDFENWIKFLGDSELANSIQKLKEKELKGEDLRKELHDLVEKRCKELHRIIGQ